MVSNAADILRQKERMKAPLIQRCKSIFDGAETAGRKCTDEELRRLDLLMNEIDQIQTRDWGWDVHRPDVNMVNGHEVGYEIEMPERKTSYRGLFGRNTDAYGFRSFADFVRTVALRPSDPRLTEQRTQTETISSEGGFAVPPAYADWLVDSALQDSVLFDKVQVYPMRSATLRVPAWSDTDHSSSINGFQGRWIGEAAAQTAQTASIRLLELSAKKIGVYCICSSELLQDSPGFEAQLAQKMTEAVSWYIDRAIIAGLGAGQPQGILASSALVPVAIEAGQTLASGLCFENIVKMFSRLFPNSAKTAVWLCHPSVLPELFGMGLVIGTGGVSVWLPGGLSPAPGGMLFGRPLLVTEHCNAVGTAGDIILVDPTKYILGMRSGLQLAKSNEIGFAEDTVAFRLIMRVDGLPSYSAPLTPRTGSSLSPYIVLGTRS